TAAELHQTNSAIYPKRVGAEWLCGEHPAAHRRVVLDRFANGLDAEGWVTDLGILASCQVLGEGVDIRGKRGVHGVVFADTRSSPVQIVQITGRGLRQAPGEGKVARLIVPVFLQPGEDPEDMMASASFRPLVAVLQGLRAHDSRLIERMVLCTASARGKATSVVALDPRHEEDAHEARVVGAALPGGAMDIELTDDDHLRAVAALEAVAGNNDEALAALAGRAGERPLPKLLAAYGQHTLHRILITAFGIDATMDYDETGRLVTEINSDPTARMLFVLTDTLHNQAALAGDDPATTKLIARSILLTIHAFTDADNNDALTLLRALRNEILRPN
ncbi:hypothetical protein ACIQE0_38705, partial [Streptomyces sp. NPDC093097]